MEQYRLTSRRRLGTPRCWFRRRREFQQEQDDGVQIIRWIASQPWCSGSVGMEGISWSGFNSLQVAARRPPALKAIITHCSTDDRYADDAHYKGGCIVNDMFGWGTVFLAIQGQPSDPDITGRERWREDWLQRLNAVEFNLDHWFDHPHRDEFWKHGSVIEDYGQITCPVYAIGGWVDAYKNSIFRLLGGLTVPRKGLVGPWTHIYPHEGVPGPAIDYLDEGLRWWDHWLKGAQTGIMDEPMLRVWMQDKSATPGELTVPGYWAAEDVWPSQRLTERIYFLSADAVCESPRPPMVSCVSIPCRPSVARVVRGARPARAPRTIWIPSYPWINVSTMQGRWCSIPNLWIARSRYSVPAHSRWTLRSTSRSPSWRCA